MTKVAENEVQAEFVVIDGEGKALPGRETALRLGVLKLDVPVYALHSKEEIISDNKKVFDGVGKPKEYQVKLHVNPNVPQWLRQSGTLCSASVTRRRKRLRNLYGYYSNEPVKGLTPWVSPVMVVPKWNDEIRLCVDMRRANVTIIRECYPIATMDEVLQSLN